MNVVEKNLALLESIYKIEHPECDVCGLLEETDDDLRAHYEYGCDGSEKGWVSSANVEFILEHYQNMKQSPFENCEHCGLMYQGAKLRCRQCDECEDCCDPSEMAKCEIKECEAYLCLDCNSFKYCCDHRCAGCNALKHRTCGKCQQYECGKEIGDCCVCGKNDGRCIACLKTPCPTPEECESRINETFLDRTPFDLNVVSQVLLPYLLAEPSRKKRRIINSNE